MLKNLELNLLEEKFKMEIVENYIKKEYDNLSIEKEEIEQAKSNKRLLEQFEKTL